MSASILRTSTLRSIPRSFTSPQVSTRQTSILKNALRASLRTSARPARISTGLALTAFRPAPKALVRHGHIAADYDTDAAEARLKKVKLQPIPQMVSAESSTRLVGSEMQKPAEEEDVDMMAGIRSDFVGFLVEQDRGQTADIECTRTPSGKLSV